MKHAELVNYIKRLQFEDSYEKRMADLDTLLRRTAPTVATALANPMALPGMREFADDCPDVLQRGMTLSSDGLYLPFNQGAPLAQFVYALGAVGHWPQGVLNDLVDKAPEPEPPNEPFETNMVEPLVGWRVWWVSRNRIASMNDIAIKWPIDKPMEAKCQVKCHAADIPRSNCTCGIYAVNEAPDVPADGHVLGTVYGWGRYVRGDKGWRSEFAYPKEFFLASNATPEIIGVLRQYHVPISVDVPTRMYDPREDGYENGYREAEAHGNSGADPQPDARQETGADGDADDYQDADDD